MGLPGVPLALRSGLYLRRTSGAFKLVDIGY
jgi:hypothetical protein